MNNYRFLRKARTGLFIGIFFATLSLCVSPALAFAYNGSAAAGYAGYFCDKVSSDGWYMIGEWVDGVQVSSIAKEFPCGTSVGDVQNYLNSIAGEWYGVDCAHFVSCCVGNPAICSAYSGGSGGLDVPHSYSSTVYGHVSSASLLSCLQNEGGGTKVHEGNNPAEVSVDGYLEEGDVIAYDWDENDKINHVALYLGNNKAASHSSSWNEDWRLGHSESFKYEFYHISAASQGNIVKNLNVPYIHQCWDTPEDFDGRAACSATSAMMLVAYYGILDPWPSDCSLPYPHTSDYGNYISKIYTYNSHTFDEVSNDYSGNPAYGAYGYIKHDGSIKEKMRDYFILHGLDSEIDYSPTEAEVKAEIDAGYPVAAVTWLTDEGHWVVIEGYTDDSHYIVNDPYGSKPYGGGICGNYNGAGVQYTWSEMRLGERKIVLAHGTVTQPDVTPPTISAFSVTPSSVTHEGSFTISYTVSDSGGSGLKQVELWRSDGDGSESDPKWQQVQTNEHSGNGPVSDTFQDEPPSVGTYWYGIHVIDDTNNYMDERLAGLGPLQRTVVAPTKIISLSGDLNFSSVIVGNSSNRTFTIANSGNSALTVISISYPAGFSGAWSGSVPANGSQNVTVTFAPTEEKYYGGMVTINSDAISGTNTISASGTGTSPPVKISGYVRTSGGDGISGVTMNGWPGTAPVTDSSGYYIGTISYGWSGMITPDKSGYTFSPTSKQYSNVTSDKLSETYTGSQITPTISGYVRTSTGTGIRGVTMTGWPGTAPVTDSSGYYSGTVSYGWSGTITPDKSGYTFSPSSKSYSNVTSDKLSENYTGTAEIIGDFCGEGSDQPDGYVDYWDLLYFAQRWHTDPSDTNWDTRCDLAKEDNYVDYWDLLVFAQQWHKGQKP